MEEINDFQADYLWLQDNYKKLKGFVWRFEKYIVRFDEVVKVFDNPDTWAQSQYESIKWKRDEIDWLLQQWSSMVTQINQRLDSVKETLTKVDQLNQNIITLESSWTLAHQEIKKLQNEAIEMISNIWSQKWNAQVTINEIVGLLESAKNQVTMINDFYSKFEDLKLKIENEEDWFEISINEVRTQVESAKILVKEISSIQSQWNKILAKMEWEKENIEQISRGVSILKEQSKADRNEIWEYLNLISDSSFANSFKDRKTELSDNAIFWRKAYLRWIGALCLFLLMVFWKNIRNWNIPEVKDTVFRVALSFPILFWIFFSGREYTKNRTSEEKYSFKFATASVFRNHIKFLLDRFWATKEWKDKVLETTRWIVDMIYEPPYVWTERNNKMEKELTKKYLNQIESTNNSTKKPDISDIVDQVKKIKDLVWDDDIWKSIIPTLFKS